MSSQMQSMAASGNKGDKDEMSVVVGAMSAAGVVSIQPTESDFALELKSAPKQTCIPMNQRRLVNSETSVNQRSLDFDMPDKSWSVLYFGAKEKPFE
ncbi:uncharacterized protein LOC115622425 [Scaptodrosophila lebanonensis]|uniref:Uncharacterized protein LOC115622425 n=1 Tax=Drosophila lebanonensis TaxID=7225 RepID=A0A6J2T5M6_DROLE|nr:uncharacterized protein LOC115622425 [Scaptodrosophila lebanonensis]